MNEFTSFDLSGASFIPGNPTTIIRQAGAEAFACGLPDLAVPYTQEVLFGHALETEELARTGNGLTPDARQAAATYANDLMTYTSPAIITVVLSL